ncbi:SdrD B-like domain-containing protein [Microbacterium sp. ZW T5_45]|uniref:SdrD B-like domain-containing protein n=1 Tax=Microbacterium sp. ZW T5_45 TaxID=3378080 RepID=UPI003853679B
MSGGAALTAAVLAAAGLVVPAAVAAPGDGVLTVEINRDFSGDGVYDAAYDPGQAGVGVTLTDGTTSVGPVVTDGDGRATFDLGTLAGDSFRIDVAITDPDLDYLQPAPAAPATTPNAFRSTTTFVDGSTQTVHIGVWNPNTYAPKNPKVAVAQQVDQAAADAVRSLMITDWDNRGPSTMSDASNTAGITTIANQGETGTVFGIAWDYRNDALFTAAYAKASTAYGPGGPGAIYRTDSAALGVGNTSLWATVPNAGTSVHQTTTGYDDAFYYAASREGLGGLALSDDGSTLYTVNLNDRQLYSFDTATAAPGPVVPIADPGCVNGEWRPFAVAVRDGKTYVGGVCDASDSLSRADLDAYVLQLDGTSFTTVFTHGLDAARGGQNYTDPTGNLSGPGVATHWNAWRNTWDPDVADYNVVRRSPLYPTPVLTSLAFENDGSLILGFRDRNTDTLVSNGFEPTGQPDARKVGGQITGGDINKVCLTNGVYEWEGTGSCANNSLTTFNGGEPAGRVEYFPGEFVLGSTRYGAGVTVRHFENSMGGVLLNPREEDVLNTTMDPTGIYNTGGLGFYDRATGAGPGNDPLARGLIIAGNETINFGKGSGLSAVSMLAEQAPIQIGNRVWYDANHDGEQDAASDEPGIPGVVVRLYAADGVTVLATTTTDENGEYYFGGEGGYPLELGVDYVVEFDVTGVDPSGLPGSPTIDQLAFTLVRDDDAGPVHDSDATPTVGNPLIGRTTVTAPDQPGEVDHTIDAGIWPQIGAIDIVKYDGRQDASANPVDGPDAVDGEYGGPTPGDWAAGVDADTQDDAVEYPVTGGTTGSQPVSMIVTNTGSTPLTDITVSDLTLQGPALTGLTCDFSAVGGAETGTTWAGPLAPGEQFSCVGQVEMGWDEVHNDIASVSAQPVDENGEDIDGTVGDEDGYWAVTPEQPVLVPGIDIVKYDGRAEAPENPVDGPDAVDGEYGGPTPGDWAAGVDADTQDDAVEYPVTDGTTGPQPVRMIVTNTGEAVLTDVSVADLTLSEPALTDLTCDFSPLGGPATGTSWEGPFAPGAQFSCVGQVELVWGEVHNDIASVTAQPLNVDGEPFGEQIGDEDGYWAITPGEPGIDIVKYDGRAEAPENPVDGPDAVDGEYSGETPGDWVAIVDADTEQDAAQYGVTDGTTGPQPVRMIITNTGGAVLTDVSVADLTLSEPALTDLTCDFSPLGGPATGTSWDGPFAPGAQFSCVGQLEMGWGEVHNDIASVTAQPVNGDGEPFGEPIGDEDGYWAITPEEPVTPGVPAVDITKRQAYTGLEADTAETAIVAKAGEKVAVQIPVTNTGAVDLFAVVVSDKTDSGPAMTDFTCVFPDGSIGRAVDGAVRWEATFADPGMAWQPGISFTCTGVVTLSAGQTHADTASVSAVAADGTVLTDSNAFHVRVPAPGLAVTGGTVAIGTIVLAMLMLGGGLVLMRIRRRSARS